VTSDINPLYLKTLENLSRHRPYMRASFCDVTEFATFPLPRSGYDTVICLNVLEHLQDDKTALLNVKRVLSPQGRVIVLVPQGPWNLGTLDRILGHRRRYSKDSLRLLARNCGFEIEQLIRFNRIGTAAWFLNGKILRRRHFGLSQIWLLNVITPLLRLIDPIMPLPALSLIAIMRPAYGTAVHQFKQATRPDVEEATAASASL